MMDRVSNYVDIGPIRLIIPNSGSDSENFKRQSDASLCFLIKISTCSAKELNNSFKRFI